MPSGKVINSETGATLPGVTIWKMTADGTSASVAGYSATDGTFNVQLEPGFSLMFSQDGFEGVNRPGLTGAANVIPMDPDGAVTVTIKKNSWLWIVAALLGFYMLETKKGKR